MTVNKSGAIFISLMASLLGLACLSTLPIQKTAAHPGDTAPDGGHYCWTRCEYWGEMYGQRHYHGYRGDYETMPAYPSAYEQGQTNGKLHATKTNREYITSQADFEGSFEGNKAASEGRDRNDYNYSSQICDEQVKFETPQPFEYSSSFMNAYRKACRSIYKAAYDLAFSNSFYEAISSSFQPDSQSSASSINIEPSDDDNLGWWILGALGTLGVGGWLYSNKDSF